mmetsp:Transcript_25991/g.37282  ORF Transcript_25991/g.37282 Transcript_25991/m.37282 type:complete len:113 (-) Transcript_25991:159-497(-)|eukprot:CAMPEP_0172423366 /NCGR_PEP_ID=MMETSP1064-20121228/15633_1 /TAXON_ID=202472 /ORGANISM="Aulacoseira subarctica , Strain CCAP 1002/5" /LENGTH=112 /DNA_ID=CAMNT_0013164707 /DNA_START=59 /DNA_END=397 /DNA_ORIENTATION=-
MRSFPVVLALFFAFVASSSAFMALRPALLPNARTTTALNVDIMIEVNQGEPIDSALRRFKREVNKSGHLIDLRHKRYHESSQEKVKRKAAQARLRKRFERMQKRRMQQQNRV